MNHRTTSARAAALMVGVLAVVLRLAFSPGLMPGRDAQGHPALVICTSAGAKVIPDPSKPQQEHKPCPYEGQAAAAPPPAPSPLHVVSLEYPPADLPLGGSFVSPVHLAAPPPPSTGPPAADA